MRFEKHPDVYKPQFFPGFCMVFTHRKLCAQAAKGSEIVPGASRTKLPTKIVLKTRLGMDSKKVWCSLKPNFPAFVRSWAGRGFC